MADAGWYPDPHDPDSDHYWDGARWSGQRRATTRTPTVAPATEPGRRRSRKLPVIAAGVVVVLVAAGLIAWLARSGGSTPALTYQGKQISAPAEVLTTAEAAVARTVSARHGVTGGDTRCYFARPKTPAPGAKRSDVGSSLRCGPVLFVDGNPADEYLSVPLSAAAVSNGDTTLAPASALSDSTPQAIGDVTLVRPDSATAPAGDGGLSVPAPPPAAANTLLATTLGPTRPPAALSGSFILGEDSKVRLLAAGEIARCGTGADARSAPSGGTLIAFQVAYGPGDVADRGNDSGGVAGDAAADQAQLYVNGKPRPIPSASGDVWDVVAIPASGAASIKLTDDQFTQSLALPSGKPGSGTIAVLQRKNRTGLIGKSIDVPIHLTSTSATADVVFHGTASVANLYFWPPGHGNDFPDSAKDAYLVVQLTYTDADDPDKTFGFDPAILQLTLPDGEVVAAQNLAGRGRIYDVFDVPGTYTTGVLSVTGSEKIAGGATLTVSKTTSFTVSIPAN